MVWPRFEATPNTFGETSPIRVLGGKVTPWVVQEGETRRRSWSRKGSATVCAARQKILKFKSVH
ncbi:UNVERIFIED_CONTAM: hypothetical protein PYX00_006091 [Menopon gallinae]|uniref:Uncharacterized protein n=1 Tax=Menopon gallinae TaxID=328185 RepID=A0AAW2HV97_9NEOP